MRSPPWASLATTPSFLQRPNRWPTILKEQGYVNYAIGKWDHTPLYEVSQIGPFDRWPSDEGFAHSYCFMAADVHQFIPVSVG